ncbi:hypothetical protein [Echinimonas agarilytica]|uniref:Uncharacterized protein n=1 Tax=Echinimonas agarilytica TaxID=1215918 RepID=A0AA42B6J1_9GAMM|nr:hypothetical protein [Echinimonas agarilytica]MCM2678491.1 hypothetical protein [Echinimonas agarilytica]
MDSNINVNAVLAKPLGNVTLGSATLNLENPTVKLGAGIAGFKTKVGLALDINAGTLKISGKLCAPFVGSTTIHF